LKKSLPFCGCVARDRPRGKRSEALRASEQRAAGQGIAMAAYRRAGLLLINGLRPIIYLPEFAIQLVTSNATNAKRTNIKFLDLQCARALR